MATNYNSITVRLYTKSIEGWMEDMVIPAGGAGIDCWSRCCVHPVGIEIANRPLPVQYMYF